MRAMIAILLALAAASPEGAVRLKAKMGIAFDGAGVGLRRPEGVALDREGTLIVADTGNGRLVRYTVGDEAATPLGEIRLSELSYPIQVEVDSKGNILALDGRLRKVARISPQGEFKGYVDPEGGDAGGAVVARAIAIGPDDSLHVLDIFHARVSVVSSDGAAIRHVALPAGGHAFSDLAVDAGGALYAVDSVESRIFVARRGDTVFSPLTDPMKADLSFPVAIAADDRGRLFVADKSGGGVVILGTDGSFRGQQSGMGWAEGSLRYPVGLCLGGGLLFVADRENNRIEVFSVLD